MDEKQDRLLVVSKDLAGLCLENWRTASSFGHWINEEYGMYDAINMKVLGPKYLVR